MEMKPLELYIHIPFCVKKCSYCDFLSFPADVKTQREYVDALLREINAWAPKLSSCRITSVYIGGGTPTWLEEKQLLRILEAVFINYNIDASAEISLECNPGTVSVGQLQAYYSAGVNRLSIGLQSADDNELKILGRIHTYGQFLKTYDFARKAGFTNVNVDLMSGLPLQTSEKMLSTLQAVVRLRPEHISLYSLIIEKGTLFYEKFKFDKVLQEAGKQTKYLPDEDEDYRIYKAGQLFLQENGYRQYEISNYARKGYACRHNIGYWKRANYLGLGLGASSLLNQVRFSNTRDLYTYIKESALLQPEEVTKLTRKEQMEEFMFLGLRMIKGVKRTDFEQEFRMPIESVYQEPLNELKEQGLLVAKEGYIFLTDEGMDLANYCMGKFLL